MEDEVGPLARGLGVNRRNRWSDVVQQTVRRVVASLGVVIHGLYVWRCDDCDLFAFLLWLGIPALIVAKVGYWVDVDLACNRRGLHATRKLSKSM